MSELLVQSCSATKRSSDEPLPAIELYDGYFYRIIAKARRNDQFNPGLDLVILSAEYGLLGPTERITPYDRRMDRERALELQEPVQRAIVDRVRSGKHQKVWINGSKEYQLVLVGLDDRLDVPVEILDGDGIGEKGHRLKELVSE